MWYIYLLQSEVSGHFYKGITTDVDRRLKQHNGLCAGGAKRTRAGRPWKLAALWGPYEGRSEATKKELQLQRLRGSKRLTWNPEERVALNR